MPKKTDSQLNTARAAVDKLHARRDDLSAEIDAARAALASAQSDAIEGKAGASDAVTTAQARMTGAEGTLTLLDDLISKAETSLASLQQAEDVERLEREAIEAARAANLAREREAEAFGSLAASVSAGADDVRAARQDWRAARARFDSLTTALQRAGGPGRNAVERRLHDLDVSPGAVRVTGWNDPVSVEGVTLDATVNAIINTREARTQ